MKNIGWRKEPARHALAAKGVKTLRAGDWNDQKPFTTSDFLAKKRTQSGIELGEPRNWSGTAYEITDLETNKTIIVSHDGDFPSLAQSFGWYPRSKKLREQVDNGEITMDLINAAVEWLDDHIGKKAEDPGYFEE